MMRPRLFASLFGLLLSCLSAQAPAQWIQVPGAATSIAVDSAGRAAIIGTDTLVYQQSSSGTWDTTAGRGWGKGVSHSGDDIVVEGGDDAPWVYNGQWSRVGNAAAKITGLNDGFVIVESNGNGAWARRNYNWQNIIPGGRFISTRDGTFAPILVNYKVNGKPMCLDIPWGNATRGAQVQIWECNNTTGQMWAFVGDTIRPLNNQSVCLDVSGGQGKKGDFVGLWDCNGGAAQKWAAGDNLNLKGQNGFCLEIKGGNNPGNGTKAGLWDCNPWTHQQWYLAHAFDRIALGTDNRWYATLNSPLLSSGLLYRWDNTRWSHTNAFFLNMARGQDNVLYFIGGDNRIWKQRPDGGFDGILNAPAGEQLKAIAVNGKGNAWAVTQSSKIFAFNGAEKVAFGADAPKPQPYPYRLSDQGKRDELERVVKWIAREYKRNTTPYCYKVLYDRGAGVPPVDCANGKVWEDGACYDRCRDGFSKTGPTTCSGGCPGGYYPSTPQFCQINANTELTKWQCGGDCPSGYYRASACTCQLDPNRTTIGRDNYERGAGVPKSICPGDRPEFQASACYLRPEPQFSCNTTNCPQQCGGMFDCGAGCASNQQQCATKTLGMVMSTVGLGVNMATSVLTGGAGSVAMKGAMSGIKTASNAAFQAAKKASNLARYGQKYQAVASTAKKARMLSSEQINAAKLAAKQRKQAGEQLEKAWENFDKLVTALTPEEQDELAQMSKLKDQVKADFAGATTPGIANEVFALYGRDSAEFDYIAQQWAAIMGLNADDTPTTQAQKIVDEISNFDPTGVASVAAAFMFDKCAVYLELREFANPGGWRPRVKDYANDRLNL